MKSGTMAEIELLKKENADLKKELVNTQGKLAAAMTEKNAVIRAINNFAKKYPL